MTQKEKAARYDQMIASLEFMFLYHVQDISATLDRIDQAPSAVHMDLFIADFRRAAEKASTIAGYLERHRNLKPGSITGRHWFHFSVPPDAR